jgi:hypothetical protein
MMKLKATVVMIQVRWMRDFLTSTVKPLQRLSAVTADADDDDVDEDGEDDVDAQEVGSAR